MAMFSFKERVALITGAGGGIGAAAAKAYAEQGADVILFDINKDLVCENAKQLCAQGHKAKAYCVDVTNEAAIEKAMKEALHEFEKIDILLNNAGIARIGSVESMQEKDWDQVLDINLKSMFFMCKYIIPIMKENHYGRIVNVSSVNAILGDKADALIRHAYNASKSGVQGLTVGLNSSYMKHGITVNAIGPGLIHTPMTQDSLFKSPEFMQMYQALCPAGRAAEPQEITSTILYLSAEESAYVGGQCIYIDGGFSHV